jgi:hypothetical protein
MQRCTLFLALFERLPLQETVSRAKIMPVPEKFGEEFSLVNMNKMVANYLHGGGI